VDDVQINVNDLMAAFAAENAALSQRAVIAEQRAKAYAARVTQLEQQALDAAQQPADSAVAEVRPGRRAAKKAVPPL
jgi:hypothetical protein